MIEDTLSLAVVQDLESIPVRLLTCVGMGTEREVCHAHILENISDLVRAEAFLGSCSLVRRMESYRFYEDAVVYTHAQDLQDPSVVNASFISAVQGQHGDRHLTEKTRGSRLWISPLMPIYWFFDLQTVAARNSFIPAVSSTQSFREVRHAILSAFPGKQCGRTLEFPCRERPSSPAHASDCRGER